MSGSKLFTLYRGDADSDFSRARAYHGFDYHARFSASKAIQIESVGFYGRQLEKHERNQRFLTSVEKKQKEQTFPRINCSIVMSIKQSSFHYPFLAEAELKTFMGRTVFEKDITGFTADTDFYVDLPEKVVIPANTIFDIVFQLSPPSSGELPTKFHCLKTEDNLIGDKPVSGCEDTKIYIHQSCCQCSGFIFRILDNTVA